MCGHSSPVRPGSQAWADDCAELAGYSRPFAGFDDWPRGVRLRPARLLTVLAGSRAWTGVSAVGAAQGRRARPLAQPGDVARKRKPGSGA
jgi:hypothetical protein